MGRELASRPVADPFIPDFNLPVSDALAAGFSLAEIKRSIGRATPNGGPIIVLQRHRPMTAEEAQRGAKGYISPEVAAEYGFEDGRIWAYPVEADNILQTDRIAAHYQHIG